MKQFFKQVFASMLGFILANVVMFFATIFIFGIIIGIASTARQQDELPDEDKPKILRLQLSGPVVERLKHRDLNFGEDIPFFGEHMPLGLYELRQTLEEAAKDEYVKGIYLEAGDVHAAPATLTALRRALLKFKESGKFIYAYSDNYSEKNYYVASVATSIFMYPMGGFELDGFAMVPGFFKEALDKLEIQPMVFRAGAYKSAVEPFIRNDLSDENRLQMTELLDGLWKVFSHDVAEARKLTPEKIANMAKNRSVSFAEEAKASKLIDEIKYEDEVLEFLRGVLATPADEDLPFISARIYSRRNKIKSPSKLIEIKREMDSDDGAQIAIIFAEGEIVSGESRDDLLGSGSIIQTLREIRDDEGVKGVVLRLNSPGGSALASDQIWREVALINSKKPVVASIGEMAASGGYYIAAGAREIFAEANSITGSIGVFGLSMMMRDFFKNKLGVSFDRIVTHPYADLGSFSRPPTDAERAQVDREIDRVYHRFLSVVDQGRENLSVDQIKTVAQGRVWTGADALRVKLIDQIGGLDAAVKRVAELAELGDDYKVKVLPRPESAFKFVMNFLSTKISLLASMEPIWWSRFKSLLFSETTTSKYEVYTLFPYKVDVK